MAILTTTSLAGVALYAVVDHDPATVATDVPKGSLILDDASGFLYLKLDDGSTTNLARVSQALDTISTKTSITIPKPSRRVIVDADASEGPLIVTLPTLAEAMPVTGSGFAVTVRRSNSGRDVKVIGQGGETIHGEVEAIIATQYSSLTFFPGGDDWMMLNVIFPDPAETLRQIELLKTLLIEARKMNTHLALLTDVEMRAEDALPT